MEEPLHSDMQNGDNRLKSTVPPLGQEEKDFLLELGECVRKIRIKAGVSQEKFYEDTSIHISRIEAGKSNLSINMLYRICSYFKISVKDFFGKIKKK